MKLSDSVGMQLLIAGILLATILFVAGGLRNNNLALISYMFLVSVFIFLGDYIKKSTKKD